jgi:hypothetical protein
LDVRNLAPFKEQYAGASGANLGKPTFPHNGITILQALPIPLFIAMIMYFSVDLSITPMFERTQYDMVMI